MKNKKVGRNFYDETIFYVSEQSLSHQVPNILFIYLFSIEIFPEDREYTSLPSSAKDTVHNSVCS